MAEEPTSKHVVYADLAANALLAATKAAAVDAQHRGILRRYLTC